jgi:hypothetical protein
MAPAEAADVNAPIASARRAQGSQARVVRVAGPVLVWCPVPLGPLLMTIGLGVVINDLFDLLPWMARKVLRLAAWVDARFVGEADFLFAEWEERMDRILSKVTKLGFALHLLCGVALVRRIDLIVRLVVGSVRRWRRRRTTGL